MLIVQATGKSLIREAVVAMIPACEISCRARNMSKTSTSKILIGSRNILVPVAIVVDVMSSSFGVCCYLISKCVSLSGECLLLTIILCRQ